MSLLAINGRRIGGKPEPRYGYPSRPATESPIPYQDYRPMETWQCAGLPVIVSIEDDFRLLPHFLQHYLFEQDCSEVVVCLWANIPADQVAPMLCGVPHRLVSVPGRFAHGRSDSDFHDQVRRAHVAPDQWYVIADLDELHEVPGFTLAEAVRAASAAGATAIAGEFVDRVTGDGSLPDHLEDDLWAQFPLQTDMTRRLLTGCTRKVLAARGDQPINAGHHDHDGPAWIHRGRVHHFKWWGNVVARQQHRLIGAQGAGVPVDLVKERRLLIERIAANGGRLPLAFPGERRVPEHWRPRNERKPAVTGT